MSCRRLTYKENSAKPIKNANKFVIIRLLRRSRWIEIPGVADPTALCDKMRKGLCLRSFRGRITAYKGNGRCSEY